MEAFFQSQKKVDPPRECQINKSEVVPNGGGQNTKINKIEKKSSRLLDFQTNVGKDIFKL